MHETEEAVARLSESNDHSPSFRLRLAFLRSDHASFLSSATLRAAAGEATGHARGAVATSASDLAGPDRACSKATGGQDLPFINYVHSARTAFEG